jgi:hypothetical protein
LWLAPDFPGRHHVAHFFLTVDYERKLTELEEFFWASDEEQVRFLVERDIRFLFVSGQDGSRRFLDVPVPRNPGSFRGLPGLEAVVETDQGTLFAFSSPDTVRASPRDSP